MRLWKDIKNLFWPKKYARRRARQRTLAEIEASARAGHVIHGSELARLLAAARRAR